MKTRKLNGNFLTWNEWALAAGFHDGVTPHGSTSKLKRAWQAGEDPSDFLAEGQDRRYLHHVYEGEPSQEITIEEAVIGVFVHHCSRYTESLWRITEPCFRSPRFTAVLVTHHSYERRPEMIPGTLKVFGDVGYYRIQPTPDKFASYHGLEFQPSIEVSPSAEYLYP